MPVYFNTVVEMQYLAHILLWMVRFRTEHRFQGSSTGLEAWIDSLVMMAWNFVNSIWVMYAINFCVSYPDFSVFFVFKLYIFHDPSTPLVVFKYVILNEFT